MGKATRFDQTKLLAEKRAGKTNAQLAKEYGVTERTISNMLARSGYDNRFDSPAKNKPIPYHERIERWVEAQLDDVQKMAMLYLKFKKPKNREEALEHEKLMSMHIERVNKLVGITQHRSAPSATVNIGIMSKMPQTLLRTESGHDLDQAIQIVETNRPLQKQVPEQAGNSEEV